jgi:hypothetical protein
MQNASENGDRKVTMFLTLMLSTLNSSLIMIKNVSYKINSKDISNSNLYLILFAYNKLSEIIDLLPDDEFKKYFKTTMKENLSKMTCYVIDNNSQINCNDFYENFLKRKKVNKEILSKVQLKTGGWGGLMIGLAVTALALIQTAIPVSSAVFSGDDLVRQSSALHGFQPSMEFEEISQKQPTNSKNKLSPFETFDFAQLDANILGVCMVNSYVAEICTGGCPSPEQWTELSPSILQRIKDSYSSRPVRENEAYLANWVMSPPKDLLLGAPISSVYSTNFVNVPDGTDMEWFKNYFSDGAKEHFSNKQSSADMAIASVVNLNHAFNVMYNINNKKLCVHDENNKVEITSFGILGVSSNSEEYICETGFFEKYQIKELNSLGNVVIETNENIFTVYNKENLINEIQPTESIFLLDNSKNTGNTDQYIEILKDVRKSIIEGKREGIDFLKENKVRLNITIPDTVLDTFTEAVDTHEQSFNINRSMSPDGVLKFGFDPLNTLAQNQSQLHRIKTAFNPLSIEELDNQPLFKGGNKNNFTRKIHRKGKKYISKKSKKSKKRKSKTKRNK